MTEREQIRRRLEQHHRAQHVVTLVAIAMLGVAFAALVELARVLW